MQSGPKAACDASMHAKRLQLNVQRMAPLYPFPGEVQRPWQAPELSGKARPTAYTMYEPRRLRPPP